MSLNQTEKEALLAVLERTGLRRGASIGDVLVPNSYRAYLNQVECKAYSVPCPAVNVPVTCYLNVPHNKAEHCPVHINIHGGGFFFARYENDAMYCARVACETHAIVVDIDYATTQDHAFPVAFEQCYEVVKWVFAQCAAWGADPSRVSVGGQSAGGTLTAAICLRAAADKDFPGKICMQILNFAGLDMYSTLSSENERFRTFGLLYADGDPQTMKKPYASPTYATDEMLKNQPAAVVITAGKCPFKACNEEYGMRLVAMGNEVTFRCFVNSRHAFTIALADEWDESQKFVIRCLNEHRA